MRFLFAISHLYFWSPLEPIAQELCSQGNVVRLELDKRWHKKWTHRYLFDPRSTQYSFGWMKPRLDATSLLITITREYLNYAAYLGVRQPTSPMLTERARHLIPKFARSFTYLSNVEAWLQSEQSLETLRRLESKLPPSWIISQKLKRFAPDVLVAGSAVLDYAKEIDYVQAARHLGIPTIVIIPSWDNLTTKGTLHDVPDWLFVWNRGQVEEAVKLHNIPEERVFNTGAPKYDPWFDMHPTADRDGFCNEIGIESTKPFLLYICSSEFIAGDETIFVDELAERMSQDPKLKDLYLLVRPHPQNLEYWKEYQAKNPNVVLWSKDLSVLDPSVMFQDFYHSIYYSIGVIGINTSAFIEAAIVDKPCIAVAANRYKYTQLGIPHFHHLLDAEFLELPNDLEETTDTITQIMDGRDLRREKRHEFVKDFLRPHGLTRPATEVLYEAIINVAAGKNPRDFSAM